MNLIILYENDFLSENLVTISGRRFEHIINFYKPKIGQKLSVGLLGSKMGFGSVTEIFSSSIKLYVELISEPPIKLPVKLILSLPRPKSFKKAIHAAVTLGVKEIYIIESWKVEKSFWKSPVLESNALHEELILALEQAKDTILPKIYFKKLFKPFIEDELPLIKADKKFVAHPYNSRRVSEKIKEESIIAIGPEGGFTEYEISKFKNVGFETLTIGERILRVEFAIPTFISSLFL